MKRWPIGIMGAAVVVVVGASVYVALLDVNQYKDEIVELVEAGTGRAFSIRGNIGLKLSLLPTVTVDGVTFGNAAWAVHDDMVTFEHVEAQLALMPLLRGELALKHVALIGGRISVETNAKGQGNWVLDLAAQDSEPDPSSAFGRIDLDQVEIRRTVIEYRTHGADVYEVIIHKLTLQSEGFDQPLILDLSATTREIPITVQGRVSAVRRLLADEPYTIDLTGRAGDIEFSLKGGVQKPLRGRGLNFLVTMHSPTLATLAAPFGRDLPQRGPVNFKATLSDIKKGYKLSDIAFQAADSKLGGTLDLDRLGDRWRVRGAIDAAQLLLDDFAAGGDASATPDRLFSDESLSFEWLHLVEGRIDFSVASLVTEYVSITDLNGEMEMNDGVLEIKPLVAKIGDGMISATIEIDGSGETPKAKLDVQITKLSLGSIPMLAQGGRVSHGPTDLTLSLAGKGRSPAAFMANANGSLLVTIGAATIENEAASIAGADLVTSLFAHLNPVNSTAGTTFLECAVVRFPIVKGVAHNKTGIAVQTRTLSILGGGTVDLRTEKIDIGAKPKPRQGIGINLSSLVDFVRLGGTLAHPRVVTDAKGATSAGLKVGAAVATGGLSILAEGLFDRATADADVCAIARGEKSLAPRDDQRQKDRSVLEATASKTKDVLESAGAKVKGLFKGLFGD